MLWCGGHSWSPRFWCVWSASGSNKRRMVKVPAAVLLAASYEPSGGVAQLEVEPFEDGTPAFDVFTESI